MNRPEHRVQLFRKVWRYRPNGADRLKKRERAPVPPAVFVVHMSSDDNPGWADMATEPVKAILDYVNGERPPGLSGPRHQKVHPSQDVIFEEARKERLQPCFVDDTAVYLRANQAMFNEVPRALGQEVLFGVRVFSVGEKENGFQRRQRRYDGAFPDSR